MRFFRTPAPLKWVYPKLTWRINTGSKDIYLTFDDGPVPGPTEFVLDVLKDHNVKATFFCIGRNIEKHPDIFRRILLQGHAAGNHTYDHLDAWKTPLNVYVDNVRACSTLLKEATPLFRPPYGRITPRAVRQLADFKIIMWDVLTYDFDARLSPDECLTGAIGFVRPGSIVVFHDSYKAEKNLTYALPRFIQRCRANGYEFKLLKASP